MAIQNILDPIFSPLLTLPSWLAILIISAVITIITTLAYKYLTDQNKMKKLKAEMKVYQKKIKELSKDDPKKAMALQQEMMGKNMEMMKHSFRPTLYTLIPLLIIFGWLNAHMAYMPLQPGVPFDVTVQLQKDAVGNVTLQTTPDNLQISKDTAPTQAIGPNGQVSWTLRAPQMGDYRLTFTHANTSLEKEIIITNKTGEYAAPLEKTREGQFSTILVGNEKIRPLAGVPIFGNWGWIGIYILFSLVMSLSLRKALGLA